MLEEFDLDTCTTLHVVVCVCVSKPGSVMWRIRRSCLMSIVLSEVKKHEFCLCVPVYVNRREREQKSVSVHSCIQYSTFAFSSSGWSNLQPKRYHKLKAIKVKHTWKHTQAEMTSHFYTQTQTPCLLRRCYCGSPLKEC